MSCTSSASANLTTRYGAFIIRLTWDQLSDTWTILLQPVNQDSPRLFSDFESLLCYLEVVMRNQPDR